MQYVRPLIEHLLEVLRNLAEKVIARVASIDAVIAVGIGQFAEVFICLNERFCVFCCIAEMHIIVCHTVNQQEFAVKL